MECMSLRKRRETKQQPSMLPCPAVPGCCLVSFHFLCDIHSIHSVYQPTTQAYRKMFSQPLAWQFCSSVYQLDLALPKWVWYANCTSPTSVQLYGGRRGGPGQTEHRIRVQQCNWGCRFFASKVASDWPSVDRFGNNFGGLMAWSQIKSVANFC